MMLLKTPISLVLLLNLVGLEGVALAQSTIQLEPNVSYQTMQGWEVTCRSWEIDKINDRYDPSWSVHAPAVLDRLVNELGINRVRLEIPSGVENPRDYWSEYVAGSLSYTEWHDLSYEKVNDNDDPFDADPAGFQFSKFDFQVENIVLPMIELAAANGESLYVNLNYVDFNTGLQGTLSHALAAEEYAEIVAVHLEHLDAEYGIIPDSIELVLEPDNTVDWRGAQLGAAAVAIAERMVSLGYNLPIAAPSNANPGNVLPYFEAMAAVPGALTHLSTLSYHRYGSTDFGSILELAESHGLQTAMLEQFDGNVEMLFEDLTVLNASAWQKWGLATNQLNNGHFYYQVDLTDPLSPQIRMEAATALLAQYFRFVRQGALRIAAASDDAALRPVAFVNTDGSFVVVIQTGSGAGTKEVSVRGLPPGSYALRTTNHSSVGSDLPDAEVGTDGTLLFSLPAGVTTIHGGSGGIVGDPTLGDADAGSTLDDATDNTTTDDVATDNGTTNDTPSGDTPSGDTPGSDAAANDTAVGDDATAASGVTNEASASTPAADDTVTSNAPPTSEDDVTEDAVANTDGSASSAALAEPTDIIPDSDAGAKERGCACRASSTGRTTALLVPALFLCGYFLRRWGMTPQQTC